ncbi:hypothetical protein PBRA_009138 [Plasmodiophora brassicae]|uniref:Uncharacterized protein n=1 Tax=Plasmodiophora brassicae TaxID=37360 RepID=A0A0G4J582_PLABS|nr:hypothetical protein PBRA_009138 [Plasmodiophora brassicae]
MEDDARTNSDAEAKEHESSTDDEIDRGLQSTNLHGKSPIFMPLKPPILRTLSLTAKDGINDFLKKYRKHVEIVNERRLIYKEDIHPPTVKSCITEDVLRGMSKYRLRQPASTITDGDIMSYLRSVQRREADVESSTDIKALLMSCSP